MQVERWKFVVAASFVLCLWAVGLAPAQKVKTEAMGGTTYFQGQLTIPWDLVEGKNHLAKGACYLQVRDDRGLLVLLISRDKASAPILRLRGQEVPPVPEDNAVKKHSLGFEVRDNPGAPSQKAVVFSYRYREGFLPERKIHRWEFKAGFAPPSP